MKLFEVASMSEEQFKQLVIQMAIEAYKHERDPSEYAHIDFNDPRAQYALVGEFWDSFLHRHFDV